MSWEQAGIGLFAFAILCEEAHVVSPIMLAWLHPGLRKVALSRPIETLLLPVVAIIGALLAPVMVIWWVYWAWNIYHFGAQHYGVSRILGWWVPKWLCVGGTAAIMVGGPLLIPTGWWRWFALMLVDFNHWLVDIGLSSHVAKCWWVFLAVIVGLGCIGFTWKVPFPNHIGTLPILWIVKARWGVGIAHFLYSRWVWQLRNPQIRAALNAYTGLRQA